MKANSQIPKDYLSGLAQNWKSDLISGIIVFLIALPLCLGIATASGVPPMAGIVAAVCGGLLVSMLGGSYVTINGPAAGLIVVILGAAQDLGHGDSMAGYPHLLGALIVAGGLLILFGLLKAGKLGDFVPSSAVHGMMAAIGLIIIIKQFPTALGVKPEASNPLMIVLELPSIIAKANPFIALIGLVSLLILIAMPYIKNKWVKRVPAPLVVMLVAIPLGFALHLNEKHSYNFAGKDYEINPAKALVTLSKDRKDLAPASPEIVSALQAPDFDMIGEGIFWSAVITIALVQGLETLISAKAVERLDPYQRKVNLNRDMSAIGGATVLSAALGGLPMIAEIVRSSANVNNGAKTRWANFIHAALLVIFVALLPMVVQMIPNAALAALLVFTGYRLGGPKVFVGTAKIGLDQIVVFVTTVVMTLGVDLLVGIASGIVMELLVNLGYGAPLKTMFTPAIKTSEENGDVVLQVREGATFSNLLAIKNKIAKIPQKQNVIIDFSGAKIVDHTVMENLHHLEHDFELEGRKLSIRGLDNLNANSAHPAAMRRLGGKAAIPAGLSNRQQELKAVAGQLNGTFIPNQPVKLTEWDGFCLTRGKRLDACENTIALTLKSSAKATFYDLKYRSGSGSVERRYENTVLRITADGLAMPVFSLEPEGLLDRLLGDVNYKDVDFDAYPKFSSRYKLVGPDEAAIRAFFTSQVIKFFEQHAGLHLQSNGRELLLITNKLLSPEEFGGWLAKADELAAALRTAARAGQA